MGERTDLVNKRRVHGSSSEAFFWGRQHESDRSDPITSSNALIGLLRAPTKSGTDHVREDDDVGARGSTGYVPEGHWSVR